MRNAAGNLIQCDDTQKGEFIGVMVDIVRPQVDPADAVQVNGLLGDKMTDIIQPRLFTALIAAAVAGDEGRKVYWQFNNQVSYSPGNNANFAGSVWFVKDSTHVTILPPWLQRVVDGGMKVNRVLSGSASSLTLTKWDVNSTLQFASTVTQTINLPALSATSPGDRITFVQTGTGGFVATLTAAGSDKINGAATLALGTAQYSKVTLESDGGLQGGAGWLQVA